MMRKKRPSAPMVLSIIAVVFSLAGTGVASVATISALNKKEKKQTRNIADSEITKKAPGLSVANADKLGGQPASFYAAAATLRTGLINANGTVDATHSDGISQANVTEPVSGVYCFNGLSPAPRSVVASIAGGTAGIQTQTQIPSTGLACPGFQFSVATVNDSNSLVPDAFTVFIH
jgi:Mrp family chromosome partitioning ATPase